MSSPPPTPGKLVKHRRENKIILEIKLRPRSTITELPWECIHIPRTKSVQRSADLGGKKALQFRLEVQGATTGTIRDALCERCTEKESRNSLRPLTIVDFASKTDIIDLKGGNAQVHFRFLCLSTHHGIADSEYRCIFVHTPPSRAGSLYSSVALLRSFQTVTKSLPSAHSKRAFELPPVERRRSMSIQQGRMLLS